MMEVNHNPPFAAGTRFMPQPTLELGAKEVRSPLVGAMVTDVYDPRSGEIIDDPDAGSFDVVSTKMTDAHRDALKKIAINLATSPGLVLSMMAGPSVSVQWVARMAEQIDEAPRVAFEMPHPGSSPQRAPEAWLLAD